MPKCDGTGLASRVCHGLSGVCQGFVQGSKLTKPLILLVCHGVMGPQGGGGGVGAGKARKCTTFWQQSALQGPMAVAIIIRMYFRIWDCPAFRDRGLRAIP